jgi:hypothetical protein
MNKLISAIVLGFLLQGCASTLKMDPQALDGQQEVYHEGVEAVISPKKALVALRPTATTYSSEGRPTIVVSVLNGTKESFNFSTEDIQVFVDEVPHRVFTYDELVAEVKRKQTWAAVAAALNGAAQSMNAANAGYSYQSGTTNAYAYDNYGNSAYGYGSYSGYTYNAAAAQQARATANSQTQANMQAIKNQTEQSLGALSSTMLKKTTVMPQAWHGGYVTINKIQNAAQPHEIKVVITAAGEEHEFLFNHFKVKQ